MPVMVLEGEILTEVIQKQIEYYFSVENLCKDLYLRGHMDPEGWVPTSLLAGFNRVKALINDPEEIIESLTYSEILECKDGKLRRKDDWKVWLLPLTEKKPDEDKKDEKKEDPTKQENNQSKQTEDKSKQISKKEVEPVKVVLAWGPEKKVITSAPQSKSMEKKTIQQPPAHHNEEKKVPIQTENKNPQNLKKKIRVRKIMKVEKIRMNKKKMKVLKKPKENGKPQLEKKETIKLILQKNKIQVLGQLEKITKVLILQKTIYLNQNTMEVQEMI